jgi:tetratricopeptide (TPR) repeat protein
LGINLYTLYSAQGANQLFLPYNAGWSIAIESLKSAKTALVGTSPDNYLNIFLQYKPGWINLTNYWNLQFSQGSNMPLTLLPTMGLLGVLAWLWLAVQIVRAFFTARPEAKPAATVALATVILQIVLPPNVVTLALQALALVAWVAAEKEHLKDVQLHAFTVQVIKSEAEVRREPHHSNLMAYVVSLLALVAFGYMGYWYARFVGGQWFEFQAMMAGLNNQVVRTYELQQQMIIWNPTSSAYRRAYSVTNMAIAVALSNAKDAPAEDRQQIIPLIQQSIREAKAAAEIDPNNSLNWVNLGRVYSNLIGAAQGADAWSAGAYTRAQAMAPTDPILTLELGGVLLQSGQLPTAEQIFTKVVELKPDWPNATYNLAFAARQNGDYGTSLDAYQRTLNLVQNNSELYAKVKAELEATQREAQRKATNQGNLPAVTKQTDQEAKAAIVKPATTSAKLRSLTSPSASNTAELSPEVRQELQTTPIEGGP